MTGDGTMGSAWVVPDGSRTGQTGGVLACLEYRSMCIFFQ
jgi:hypothetical protein